MIIIIIIIKYLFVSSTYTMALRAIEKNIYQQINIYQYITANTKTMTTKIEKGLKTDSDSKTKVKAR